jgi:ElaB/YqjD/DUF883 family membrane-anchored ribosome-binding protein
MASIHDLRRSARRGGSEMADQLAELQDSIEAMSHDLERMVRRSTRSARGSAWDFFGNAQDTLGDSYDVARDTALDAARYGRRMVRRHPVPAAALAAGVGLIIIGLAMNMAGSKNR